MACLLRCLGLAGDAPSNVDAVVAADGCTKDASVASQGAGKASKTLPRHLDPAVAPASPMAMSPSHMRDKGSSSGRPGPGLPDERATSLSMTKRAASLKACLRLEHYSFIRDVSTPHAAGAGADSGTPTVSSLFAGLQGEGPAMQYRLSRNGAAGLSSRKASSTAMANVTGGTGGTTPGDVPAAPTSTAGSARGSASGHAQEELPDEVLLSVSSAMPPAMRRARWSSGDYVVLEHLHRGHSSIVFKAQCQASGEVVAVKVYRLMQLHELQRLHLFREIKLHSSLNHPNIVQFYAAFMDGGNVFIVQEYAEGGDLLSLMFKYGGKIPEASYLKLVLVPLLGAVHCLHSHGILHRDIKPENVLFSAGRAPKLADLGLAIDMREERPNSNAGTLDYMAPEVLTCPLKRSPDENKANASAPGYGPEADAWALGAVSYEMMVGTPPFKGFTEADTTHFILTGELQLPTGLSAPAKDFINRALARALPDRLRVADMLQHPWVLSARELGEVPLPLELGIEDQLPLYGGGSGGPSWGDSHHHAAAGGITPFEPLPEGENEGLELTNEVEGRGSSSGNLLPRGHPGRLDGGGLAALELLPAGARAPTHAATEAGVVCSLEEDERDHEPVGSSRGGGGGVRGLWFGAFGRSGGGRQTPKAGGAAAGAAHRTAGGAVPLQLAAGSATPRQRMFARTSC